MLSLAAHFSPPFVEQKQTDKYLGPNVCLEKVCLSNFFHLVSSVKPSSALKSQTCYCALHSPAPHHRANQPRFLMHGKFPSALILLCSSILKAKAFLEAAVGAMLDIENLLRIGYMLCLVSFWKFLPHLSFYCITENFFIIFVFFCVLSTLDSAQKTR